jgi:TIGR03009 family protein
MNRQVAWTMILFAAVCVTNRTLGQTANPSSLQKKAGAQAAPAAGKVAVDPAAQKAQRDAEIRSIQAMNPILTEWEKRSAIVSSLDAVFDKIVRDKAFGDEWFRGRALLQSPDKACLQFVKYKMDAKNKPIVEVDAKGKKNAVLEKEPDSRTVCTGDKVLVYNWGTRSVTVYPLNKNVQQKALQEGPLPFLFNMKAAEAKKRYSMSLLEENEKQYKIAILPRQEIDQQSFEMAQLWLNKTSFLPDMLVLYPVGRKNYEIFIFNGANDEVRVNGKQDPKYFEFQKFPEFKVVYNDDAPKAVAPAAVQAQPKQQTAQPGIRVQPR